MKIDLILRQCSKNLRKTATIAEEVFWQATRNRKFLGLKFKRQYVIETYIVDFICLEKKLIIELDGDVHRLKKEMDAYRTNILHILGFQVLRFQNNEILDNLSLTLSKIKSFIGQIEDYSPYL